MGQREEYLQSNTQWDAALSRDERLLRWPSSASFGLALSGKTVRAVAAAERAVGVAEAAREVVLHQAVYALLNEGESVREIADHLGLSKSKIGRVVKSLTRDGSIANLAFLAPLGSGEASRDLVLEAWGFSSVDSSTVDHPRRTLEAEPATPQTDFGGTNG